jgi:NADH:ubiquinone oxidoreductase subunit 2 (subunit N)
MIKAFSGWFGKKEFTPGDKKIALFTLISTHLQLVIGAVLYFLSPYVQFSGHVMSDNILRFYTVEHISMMLIAIALITVGYSTSKRAEDSETKFKKLAIWFTIGLIIILVAIPWPFRIPVAGWG